MTWIYVVSDHNDKRTGFHREFGKVFEIFTDAEIAKKSVILAYSGFPGHVQFTKDPDFATIRCNCPNDDILFIHRYLVQDRVDHL